MFDPETLTDEQRQTIAREVEALRAMAAEYAAAQLAAERKREEALQRLGIACIGNGLFVRTRARRR